MGTLKLAASSAVIGLVLSLGAAPAAQANALAYIVHGIPGEDLGLDPDLPVDVSVSGTCALPGFVFGEIVGPVELPEGSYDIAISLANPEMPCSNDPVIEATGVMLEDKVSYSIVAYLTEDGTPTAGVFENALGSKRGRVTVNVFHTAKAPAVDVSLNRMGRERMPLVIENLANGEQASAQVRVGRYAATIAPAGTDDVVFGPAKLLALPFVKGYLVYAVGSLETGTFTLLVADAGSRYRGCCDDDDDDDDDDDNDD